VPPPEELSDEGLVNPPLSEEHLEHPVAEEMLQNVEVYLRKRNEPARWCEHPVGHQGVQVGVEVHQVPVGLDGDDDAGDGARSLLAARKRVFRASAAHWQSFPRRRRSLRKSTRSIFGTVHTYWRWGTGAKISSATQAPNCSTRF